MKVNKETYLKLVKEDIEWLLKNTERTLERDHIIVIIKESILQHYPNEEPIDEDKLDVLAKDFAYKEVASNYEELFHKPYPGNRENFGFISCKKAGYRKAMEI